MWYFIIGAVIKFILDITGWCYVEWMEVFVFVTAILCLDLSSRVSSLEDSLRELENAYDEIEGIRYY